MDVPKSAWANDYQHFVEIRREIETRLQHVA
jgi:hypothetical protein